jgi:hypothetical protein
MQVAEHDAAERKHRQGTNVRRRRALVGVRLTVEEYAEIMEVAENQRRSPGSVLRAAFFRDRANERPESDELPRFGTCSRSRG